MSHLFTRPGLALTAGAALLLAVTPALSAAAVTSNKIQVVISGTGTPGIARTGTVTITDGNGQPLDNEPVTLKVDRGFFTNGKPISTNAGDLIGDLTESGQTLTTHTGTDGTGTASFQLVIKRDAGFDDDGRVTSVVTATDGAVSKTGNALWNSADPLNGGSLDVALSRFQEHPVAPTVAGDNTYFNVTARDQFGNPVAGEDIGLDAENKPTIAEWNAGPDFVSDLTDNFGDIFLFAPRPGILAPDIVWHAPQTTYTGNGTHTVSDEEFYLSKEARADYYDVDFNGSTYSLTSSVGPAVVVGSTVTQIVTVTDQLGRPVRGHSVQFFRFGPDGTGGERVGEDKTNDLGQASYSYVGSTAGTARVTAVVSDGLARRTLTSETAFRYNVPASLKVAKGKKVAGKDVLQVSADPHAAGAAVSVFRVVGGTLKPVPAKGNPLDGSGQGTFKVKDKNGKKATTYVVTVQPTAISFAATSAPTKVR